MFLARLQLLTYIRLRILAFRGCVKLLIPALHGNVEKAGSSDITDYKHAQVIWVACPGAVGQGHRDVFVRNNAGCSVDNMYVARFDEDANMVLIIGVEA